MVEQRERGRLVYLSSPQQIEYREYDLPEPEPGGILVQIIRANVCGSELHIWRGHHPTVKQCVMGHEMVGRVHRLGAGVETDYAGEPLVGGGPHRRLLLPDLPQVPRLSPGTVQPLRACLRLLDAAP